MNKNIIPRPTSVHRIFTTYVTRRYLPRVAHQWLVHGRRLGENLGTTITLTTQYHFWDLGFRVAVESKSDMMLFLGFPQN